VIDPSLPDAGARPLSHSLLRQFAALWLLVCGALAYRCYALEQWTAAIVFAGLALTFGPAGLVWPGFIRPLFVLLSTLTYPIGWVISHVFLAVLYYGVLTPFSALFRLMGRDVLCRRKRPGQSSYWTVRGEPADVGSYFRQS
jgi:hypothetical protein